jgi:hypothetical protein
LLTKQGFDIGFVIHDENINAQFLPPIYLDMILSFVIMPLLVPHRFAAA